MRSDTIKKGFDRAPHRALLKATGVSDADMGKLPGHVHQRRYSAVDLRTGTPDFVKLAEAYGIKGIRVARLGDLDAAMAEAKAHPGPVFLEVCCEAEENVFPIVPPGGANTEAVLKR